MKSLYDSCLSLGLAVDSDEAVYVFAESVLYLVGATGAFEFQKHIKPFCKTRSAKVFRLSLRENKYSNLDIKLFMLDMATDCISSVAAHRVADEHGIVWRDARLCWMLFQNNEWFRAALVRKLKSYRRFGCSWDIAEIDRAFAAAYPTVLKYIKHLTYNKLRFLVRANNSTLQDYHSELSIKLVQSYYAAVPISMSEAHLVNYLKKVAHNHAVNLIKSATTQKRGRIVSSQDSAGVRKFDMLCLSQNQMSLTETGELQDVDGIDEDSVKQFEVRFALVEVLDNLKPTGRKRRLLSLLLGEEDKEFSTWLKTRGLCRPNEDNVDVQHAICPQEYTRLASEFLNVSKGRVDTFLSDMKTQLAW